MSKFTLTFLLILTLTSIRSQEIKFDSRVNLFDHPVPNNGTNRFGYTYPYLPFDYNGDGLTDFIGATFSKQYLYKGLSTSEFQQIDIYQGFAHNPIKIVDFDKDGKLDAVMDRYINRYISGDNFEFYYDGDVEDPIFEVEDFNRDGKNDLLSYRDEVFGSDKMIIYFNEGVKDFRSFVISDQVKAEAIKLVDIDSDGDMDIFVTYFLETAFGGFLINDGDENFELKEILVLQDLNFSDVEFSDFNGDNKPDLIASGDEKDLFVYFNETLLSNDLIFNYDYQINTPGEVVTFHFTDLNNDKYKDFILWVKENKNFQIRILEGSNGNNFTLVPFIGEIANEPSFYGLVDGIKLRNNLSVYDFDNDGKKDIIVTDGFSAIPKIALFKNLSDITSVKENALKDFRISPNPVSDYLNISSDNIQTNNTFYTIKSITGSNLKSGKLEFNNSKIELQSLPNGLYLIELLDRFGKIEVQKFIKQ